MKLETVTPILSRLSQQSVAPLEVPTERHELVAALEKPHAVTGDNSETTLEETDEKRSPSSWAVFGSSFLTIFLAEFGDKTQLSTLLMSAESQSPWVVLLGSAVALITTSLLGVLLGQWLANQVNPKTMKKAAGVSLLLISAMLLWEVVQF